ncbi:MAG: RNA-splicing ligase RtcB [Armatimonadetes bacterium CG07_land_8_20_14_0_80_40_9]|nr:MAG: RNA-splicing ligase RtcB [Armatimonadetes bacterium CG07_land_8_20_14_0_80_40_9]
MGEKWKGPLEKIDDYHFRIPKSYRPEMRTEGIIFTDEELLKSIREDQAPEQIANVATLPGIAGNSLAMPDIHWGYGFPIGGVAATYLEEGIISPGGVGYDINCGVRLLRSDLQLKDIQDKIPQLVDSLFVNIPSGVGSKGKIRISQKELDEVLNIGAKWAVDKGLGWSEDLKFTEEGGRLKGADPTLVSERAKKRGLPQLGTLGSGNHFLEIQLVEEVYDSKTASAFGIFKGQIVVMIHTGSRGLGYQVCDDYLKVMKGAIEKYNIKLPDRQLACAPVNSKEGKDYFAAMACAANYAWANRQCIIHWAREAIGKVLNVDPLRLGMRQVYDVAHNIAKFEEHTISGKKVRLCVHRKGATRSFPSHHPDIPQAYYEVGQPVLIPGDMGRNSYLLVGTERAMKESFGSTCHGAGRLMSRTAAKRAINDQELRKELDKKGIVVRAATGGVLSEEAPLAYKDVNKVVEVCQGAGISLKVAKMRPLGCAKG